LPFFLVSGPAFIREMSSPIDLDHQLQFGAIEIDNKVVDRPLAQDREFEIPQQTVPDFLFGFGGILSHFTG
jgi:hypothetical protein